MSEDNYKLYLELIGTYAEKLNHELTRLYEIEKKYQALIDRDEKGRFKK